MTRDVLDYRQDAAGEHPDQWLKFENWVLMSPDIDADVELKSTPAAALSEQEVLKLRWLAAQGRFIRCGECGRQMLVDVTRASGRCHGCGVQWAFDGPRRGR